MMINRLLTTLAGLALILPAMAAEDTAWTDTLERISSGVVSIRVDSTRAFDTEWNSSSQATGFVVDAEQGLILCQEGIGETPLENQEDTETTDESSESP